MQNDKRIPNLAANSNRTTFDPFFGPKTVEFRDFSKKPRKSLDSTVF